MVGYRVPHRVVRVLSVALLLALILGSPGLSGITSAQFTSSDELEAFVDPIVQDQMDEYDIPGVAIAIVQDGEIVLSKGYGVVEDGSDEPIDPDVTIFDTGSVGKLFTATAVMQQVEAGTLDLDTDLNTYMSDVTIPDTYDEPITLRHALTHTPGFDERLFLGMIAPGPDEIQPLDEYLNEHMPPRIRPPGEVNQYSNTGMVLAGYAVEEVTGETFDEYIENHIFEPLGMDRSTYDYPADLVPDMAIGHESTTGATMPMEIWHLNDRPAGGLRTTVTDIAQFMMAHLDEGGAILEPETVETMHQTHFRANDGISGSALGFIEHQSGDRRGIHHGGQWIGFSSLMYLLPEENAGIFVSANHGSAIYTQFVLIEEILAEYFPASFEQVDPAGSVTGSVEGTYRWNRVDRHTFLQLMSMISAHTMTVEDHGDGTISTTMSPRLLPDTTWVEVEPGVFQEIDGTDRIGFSFNDDEAVTLSLAWPLLMTMDRVAWYESAGLHIGLLAFFLIALLTTAGWPVLGLIRRFRGREIDRSEDHARTRLLAGAVSGLVFGFLIGTLLLVATDTVGFFQIPTMFKVLLWLPIIAALLTIPLVVFVVRLWMNNGADPARRILLSLIAVAMVGLIPYLWIWGVLGFNY
ncbi:MAG: class A beta-lactamase-related serine hydrolase [Sphaerobacteraceae bacterium]|nr:MAG: class A beta-lactamase-related serine hydrolase [Sphaerobacteraceae bacterium]